MPNAKVLARTLLSTVELGYPFVRREAMTVRGSAGMDLINQDVRLDNIALSRDRLRVGFMRLALDAQAANARAALSNGEPPWRLTALFELRQGLHIIGATRDCGPLGVGCLALGNVPPSRLLGQTDATVLRFTG